MKRAERGVVLLFTLVLLLVITLLAVSSVRDSALETRVMARDLEHQRLFNAAEAGLRDAERRIATSHSPLAPCGIAPCLLALATNNAVDFSQATVHRIGAAPNDAGTHVRWYIRQIPLATRQPVDARYGAAARPPATLYYEVSSQAFFAHAPPVNPASNCSDGTVCLRSVVTRTFVEGGL